ncbi:acyl-CoA desaturase [Thiohalophilus sp.]|uniref:acyl-CoA desaturase n=1 Tax=Thiohalophilus sp. TaxID=3028392 RepID=UPI002ACE5A25|nr:acyl-CoA desaturase [Thiohalophilus sp.]MDZ7804523.1 acyl-CoA desaturase [Thiohalophilus sp.]
MNNSRQLNSVSASRWLAVLRWFDSSLAQPVTPHGERRIDWLRAVPFIVLHVAVLGVFWTGASAIAVSVAIALYALRMFAITGFYHRYFSHRAFKTSRATQFVFAVLGASAVQRGPLWWAGHHRQHHARSDQPRDVHSPRQQGFWWSHHGWFLSQANFAIPDERIRDFARYPELRFLDRFDALVPLLLMAALYLLGEVLAFGAPEWGTNGPQMVMWGFVISTVVLYHITFTINSLAHRVGRRTYSTRDDSRNNWWLALLTFGEGWHNNHHYYPGSARQGFRWWQIDLTYYLLRLLAATGLIWDLRPVPQRILREAGTTPAGKQPTRESTA